MIHPAKTFSFNNLYDGLLKEIEIGNVSCISGPDGLELFSYRKQCYFDNTWNPITKLARGLILDPKNKQVVATPFVKFFQYGENKDKIMPDLPFTITEKVDGSLGIVFRYRGELYATTSGSFDSDQAIWALDWVKKNLDTDYFKEGETWLFEIVYPENRLVITYDFSGLVLLSVYGSDGIEWEYPKLVQEAKTLEVRVAEQHHFSSVKEMLELTRTLPVSKEGWVVRFSNGHRIKIKGEEYIRLHRLVAGVIPTRVWQVMLNGDDLTHIAQQLPSETRLDFEIIVGILSAKFAELITEVEAAYIATSKMDDKECAVYLQEHYPEGSAARRFVFPARKDGFFEQVKIAGTRLRKAAFKTFRPTDNTLAGYTPTSAMNRFHQKISGVDGR